MKIQASSIQRQVSELKNLAPKIKDLESKTSPLEVDKEDLKLREASKKLEGQFLSMLIKSMESTVPKEDNKQSLSTMMFSSVMGKEMSQGGGIGLADFIYKSLKEHGTESLDKISEMGAYTPFYAPKVMGEVDE